MINDLESSYTAHDLVNIRYSEIEKILSERNIKMHHLANHKHLNVRVFKDLEIEGDNDFWGNINTLPRIGAFSYTGSNFDYGVKIGRYCSLASNIKVMGAHHFPDWVSTSPVFYREGYHDVNQENMSHIARMKRKINIGNDVWIGADVVLANNIDIGDGAIIASNSIVTKNVPPYMIVGGVPAKVIKPRFNKALVEELLKSEWWKYHKNDFHGMKANNPVDFISELKGKVCAGKIKEYTPPLLKLSDVISKY